MKIKLLFISLSLLLNLTIWCQNRVDTFSTNITRMKIGELYNDQTMSSDYDSIYRINNIDVDSVYYSRVQALYDSIEIIFVNNYLKIYSNGIIQEEGIWNFMNFKGAYKQYYPNGELKMEGQLNDESEKIGVWKYFKNGKVQTRKYRKGKWWNYIQPPKW